MGLIAGLDLATVSGVCVGRPGCPPEFFTRDLGAKKGHEHRFAEAIRLARYLIVEKEVEAIGIEAPIIVPGRDKKANNELLMGIVANIRGFAYLKGIKTKTFETQTIDKTFLGYVCKAGRVERKKALKKQCQLMGWNPKTQDEADAGAVWETMCCHVSPAYAASSGLLLSRRY